MGRQRPNSKAFKRTFAGVIVPRQAGVVGTAEENQGKSSEEAVLGGVALAAALLGQTKME